MSNDQKDLYNNIYFKSQLRKFLHRKENHWASRIEKVFKIISKIDLRGNTVLDLGTSIGTFAFEFVSRRYKTTGIDSNKQAINIARQLARKNGKEITYVVGDVADKNNFDGESFDIIYAGDIIEHLLEETLSKTVNNSLFWLKSGGYFIFHTVPTKYNIVFHKSPLWIILVPFSIFPDRYFKKAVHLVYTAFNISLKLLTGKSYIEKEKKTVHCNLQTKDSISTLLNKTGFEILKIEVTIMEERFLRGLKKYFFRNKEYFQKDIFGIGCKPFNLGGTSPVEK